MCCIADQLCEFVGGWVCVYEFVGVCVCVISFVASKCMLHR